ncbi:hypothetical protein KVR01_011878 [Diaporthe batatas]|uniref:uncharacterized protein n=1 Tax=Diaporthe batatas TaxID=748121 RepID=UPI001D041A3E|nr:uncharacterized protein KVR01_011878 [Diaporthe batatas]KAG8158117.1 hypothetical protein KVR01_011878 [Diaporthe batatas]
MVKDFSDGHHIGLSSRSTALNEIEYQELIDRIEAEAELDEHIWRRIRFSYSPAEKRLTIHMVNRLHDTCGAILSTEIHNLVKGLAQKTSDSVISRIIEGIDPVGSSEIIPSAGPYKYTTKLRPDASF